MRSTKLFSLLDWYLGSQLFLIVLFAVVLFSIIWLAPETLFKLTQYVFGGQISPWQGLVMFLLHLPQVLPQTIPIAVLLGTIILFQRLSQNYELVALLASGISPARILAAVLWIGLLFGGFHAAVNEWVIPNTANWLEKYYTDAELKDVPDRNFLFVEKNHDKKLSKFFLIGQIQKPELSDFIILYYTDTPQAGVQISRIIRANTGRWMPKSHQWELKDGIEYVLDEDGVYHDIRQFSQQQIRTDKYAAILLDYTQQNPMIMPWGQLRQYIRLMKEGGQLQDVPFFEVRVWQKWSAPVATIIFALLGALLGMERVRTNRVYGLLFGVIVVFFYSILVPFSGSFGSLDLIAPWLVAWIPLMAAILTTLVLHSLRPTQG
ncbi:LptF/LptG family permease [Vampirovibrio sp.]|uniref:LptF/LptG family permease n=1 Tax=Vampirovibrio sp. TaxID=2717857 RepID=UPI0035943725